MKQRYCKTCGKEVGKGKSYCVDNNNMCRPSYLKRIKPQFERKCKTCGKPVGKGKSYCHTNLKSKTSKCSPYYKREREKQKKYYHKNKDQWYTPGGKYYETMMSSRKEPPVRFCQDCKEKGKDVIVEKRKFYCKEHLKLRKQKIRKEQRRTWRKKPENKLRANVSTQVWQSLVEGKNNKSTWKCLPYTPQELKENLESKFEKGMTWDNYGLMDWHIDNIIPQSTYKFDSLEHDEFKRCWDLDNLQPLLAQDNWKKNNKF